jgi:hypothetical protein
VHNIIVLQKNKILGINKVFMRNTPQNTIHTNGRFKDLTPGRCVGVTPSRVRETCERNDECDKVEYDRYDAQKDGKRWTTAAETSEADEQGPTTLDISQIKVWGNSYEEKNERGRPWLGPRKIDTDSQCQRKNWRVSSW